MLRSFSPWTRHLLPMEGVSTGSSALLTQLQGHQTKELKNLQTVEGPPPKATEEQTAILVKDAHDVASAGLLTPAEQKTLADIEGKIAKRHPPIPTSDELKTLDGLIDKAVSTLSGQAKAAKMEHSADSGTKYLANLADNPINEKMLATAIKATTLTGDSGVTIKVDMEAKAGVGWLKGTERGGMEATMMRNPESGLIEIKMRGEVGVGAEAGKKIKGVGVAVGVEANAAGELTYRFKTPEEAAKFLLYQVNEIPLAGKVLDLAPVPDGYHPPGAVKSVAVGAAASASLEVGHLEVSGQVGVEKKVNFYPNGQQGDEVKKYGKVEFAYKGIEVEGEVAQISRHGDPVPGMNGVFREAELKIMVNPAEVKEALHSAHHKAALMEKAVKLVEKLDMGPEATAKMAATLVDKLLAKAEHSGHGGHGGVEAMIGVEIKAVWEAHDDHGPFGLATVSVGVVGKVKMEKSMDLGVVEGKGSIEVEGKVMAPFVIGTGDTGRAYMENQFFADKQLYERYKSTAGWDANTVVAGRPLSEWESQWSKGERTVGHHSSGSSHEAPHGVPEHGSGQGHHIETHH